MSELIKGQKRNLKVLSQSAQNNLNSVAETKSNSKQYSQIINERINHRLEEARSFVNQHEYYSAINGYTKVIFLQPKHAETYSELGDVYNRIHDINMAITLYKKSNALQQSLVTEQKMKELLFRKGFMLLASGEHSDILEGTQYESFSRRLRYDLQSMCSDIYYYKPSRKDLISLKIAESHNKSIKDSEMSRKDILESQEELNTKRSSQNQIDQQDQSQSKILVNITEEERVWEEKRQSAFPHFLRAYCLILTYHKQFALDELDIAIQKDDKYIHAYLLKGKVLWSLGRYAEGNEFFWKAEGLCNDHVEVKDFLQIIVPKADELLKETRYLLVQNQLEKCHLNIKKGLQLFPNNTQFLLIKAFIYRKSNEYENSLNNLLLAFHTLRDKALEFEVKNQIALTYNEMGMVCFNRNQHEEAIALFNESLQFKPNDWGVFTNKGDCYKLIFLIIFQIRYGGIKLQLILNYKYQHFSNMIPKAIIFFSFQIKFIPFRFQSKLLLIGNKIEQMMHQRNI